MKFLAGIKYNYKLIDGCRGVNSYLERNASLARLCTPSFSFK